MFLVRVKKKTLKISNLNAFLLRTSLSIFFPVRETYVILSTASYIN